MKKAERKAFGLRIRAIISNSHAEKAGLEVGDVLVAIDHSRVRSFSEYVAAKEAAKGRFTATVMRGDQLLEFSVKKS